mgnify:CR=1 FL=1
MGKKKRKDLIKENLTNTDVTNTDVVGFGEMAIQQTITNCSDIANAFAAIVERFNAFDAKMQKFSGQQRTATPVATAGPQSQENPGTRKPRLAPVAGCVRKPSQASQNS